MTIIVQQPKELKSNLNRIESYDTSITRYACTGLKSNLNRIESQSAGGLPWTFSVKIEP